MSASEKLANELKALAIASLYFGVWIGVLVLLKKLILSDYLGEGGIRRVLTTPMSELLGSRLDVAS